jgi:hypothetical protein
LINLHYKEPTITSGTGADMCSKLTLGPMATIALEIVPFRASTIFQMQPGSRVLRGCTAPLVILPLSPQLRENCRHSVLVGGIDCLAC